VKKILNYDKLGCIVFETFMTNFILKLY